jgi:hypothetical protein
MLSGKMLFLFIHAQALFASVIFQKGSCAFALTWSWNWILLFSASFLAGIRANTRLTVNSILLDDMHRRYKKQKFRNESCYPKYLANMTRVIKPFKMATAHKVERRSCGVTGLAPDYGRAGGPRMGGHYGQDHWSAQKVRETASYQLFSSIT